MPVDPRALGAQLADQAGIDANTAEITALDTQVQAALTGSTTTSAPVGSVPPSSPPAADEAPARADVP